MRQILSTLIVFIISAGAYAQNTQSIANQAFIVTRMVEKFHVQPKALDDSFSIQLFNKFLAATDKEHAYFTNADVLSFNAYATRLDDEISLKKTEFLALFVRKYQERLKQADSLLILIGSKKIDLLSAENFTVKEDTSHPESLQAMHQKWQKLVRIEMLEYVTDIIPSTFKGQSQQEKKFLDSLEVKARAKTVQSLKHHINTVLQDPAGFVQSIGNLYCKAIATCYDPHTEFFPLTEKENFEGELGKQPFRFGFRIKASPSGGLVIDNLEPGSPAYKSGKLNMGDKFLQVQWEGKDAVDVSNATRQELSELLDASNHSKITISVKKADGTVAQVPLVKEQASDDDEDNKVKSFLLKGAKTVGYIYLPAFYEDWVSGSNNVKGCANDVAKEIIKLKQENIDGLILDLRYNGGGSVQEAVELAGIFIDAGPVGQMKTRDPKVFTLKDMNRGTIFDGPLAVLVNGASASASELLAGALQDYNRAVIIGSPTYGKATGQVVLPMDTTVTFETASSKQTDSYIKVTTGTLYRVNGTTAQAKGVQPDIVLPDFLDAYLTYEKDEPMALRVNGIDANKYYKPNPVLSVAASLKDGVQENEYFKRVKQVVAIAKNKRVAQDMSLSLKDFLATTETDGKPQPASSLEPGTLFQVENNRFEKMRLSSDMYMGQLNEAFKKTISKDPSIEIAYKVAAGLQK